MCTGLELMALGAAGVGGGSYLQNESMQAKAEAQENAALEELLRQEQFDDKRMANFSEALGLMDRDRIESEMGEAAAGQTERLNEAAGVTADPAPGSYGTSKGVSTPKVVADYGQGKRQEAADFVAALGDARGRLGGWGEAMFGVGEGLDDIGRDQNQLLQRGRRSAQIGNVEAREAYNRTGNKRALGGNVLSTLGQVGMMAGGQMGGLGQLFGSAPTTVGGAVPSQFSSGMFDFSTALL